MIITNSKTCPICGATLNQEIHIDECDALRIVCPVCGKYAMSMVFYEDHIAQERHTTNCEKLFLFLKSHQGDSIRPFFSQDMIPVPDGFRCYPYSRCILGNNYEK